MLGEIDRRLIGQSREGGGRQGGRSRREAGRQVSAHPTSSIAEQGKQKQLNQRQLVDEKAGSSKLHAGLSSEQERRTTGTVLFCRFLTACTAARTWVPLVLAVAVVDDDAGDGASWAPGAGDGLDIREGCSSSCREEEGKGDGCGSVDGSVVVWCGG